MLIPGVYIKGNDLSGILNGKIKALLETSMINWSALLVLYHDKLKPRLLVTSRAIPLELYSPLRDCGDAALGLETKHAAWNVIPCVLMGSSHHCHYYVPQKSLSSTQPYETSGAHNMGFSRNHSIA